MRCPVCGGPLRRAGSLCRPCRTATRRAESAAALRNQDMLHLYWRALGFSYRGIGAASFNTSKQAAHSRLRRAARRQGVPEPLATALEPRALMAWLEAGPLDHWLAAVGD